MSYLFLILFTTTLSVLFAMLWYHPKVFGGLWIIETNHTPQRWELVKKQMSIRALGSLLITVITIVLVQYIAGTNIFTLLALWTVMIVPSFSQSIWENNRWKLSVVNAGFWLGVILIYFGLSLILW